MSGRYILVGGEPVEEPDLQAWGEWHAGADRTVGKTDVGDVTISTVFLAVDHSFTPSEPPVLWETMVFGGIHDQFQERYTSLADAEAGHVAAIAKVKRS